jgi:hypothetical protein
MEKLDVAAGATDPLAQTEVGPRAVRDGGLRLDEKVQLLII